MSVCLCCVLCQVRVCDLEEWAFSMRQAAQKNIEIRDNLGF